MASLSASNYVRCEEDVADIEDDSEEGNGALSSNTVELHACQLNAHVGGVRCSAPLQVGWGEPTAAHMSVPSDVTGLLVLMREVWGREHTCDDLECSKREGRLCRKRACSSATFNACLETPCPAHLSAAAATRRERLPPVSSHATSAWTSSIIDVGRRGCVTTLPA